MTKLVKKPLRIHCFHYILFHFILIVDEFRGRRSPFPARAAAHDVLTDNITLMDCTLVISDKTSQ